MFILNKMNIDTNSDIIEDLPSNKLQPSHGELQIMDKLFYQKPNYNLISEVKTLSILAILFMIMSLDIVKNIINKFIPISNNSIYITLLIQALIFVIVYWLINNFWLST